MYPLLPFYICFLKGSGFVARTRLRDVDAVQGIPRSHARIGSGQLRRNARRICVQTCQSRLSLSTLRRLYSTPSSGRPSRLSIINHFLPFPILLAATINTMHVLIHTFSLHCDISTNYLFHSNHNAYGNTASLTLFQDSTENHVHKATSSCVGGGERQYPSVRSAPANFSVFPLSFSSPPRALVSRFVSALAIVEPPSTRFFIPSCPFTHNLVSFCSSPFLDDAPTLAAASLATAASSPDENCSITTPRSAFGYQTRLGP